MRENKTTGPVAVHACSFAHERRRPRLRTSPASESDSAYLVPRHASLLELPQRWPALHLFVPFLTHTSSTPTPPPCQWTPPWRQAPPPSLKGRNSVSSNIKDPGSHHHRMEDPTRHAGQAPLLRAQGECRSPNILDPGFSCVHPPA